MSDAAVAIVEATGLSAEEKLAAALDGAVFWTALQGAHGDSYIAIKPELAGFAAGSPTFTDPALVEALIDLLHDHGYANVVVVGAADSSALWAENRDLYALTDLLGYRFITSNGRPYDILDLADEVQIGCFSSDSVLHGSALSRAWFDADIRIVFSKNRTDEENGYALCLDTLIDVLPLTDKTLHYRRRRHPGDVAAALLDAAPVNFCLIDAVISGHGTGGGRAPTALETGTIIAASDIVLADQVGAMKMQLDPQVSPVFARVIRTHPSPQRYAVTGSLAPYAGWINVPVAVQQATQLRSHSEVLDRLVTPWLQQLDPAMFPLKQPLDARVNTFIVRLLADSSNALVCEWALVALSTLIGSFGLIATSYRTLLDKDLLVQRAVPLHIDPQCMTDDAFRALLDELRELEPIAAGAPAASDELRWQYAGEAVVFQYTRRLPIDYACFVQRVDVARTIQYMNDYLGGVLVPLTFDEAGRPVRQAERNIYLPQPNYLALYDGKPIDVTKVEVVEYGDDSCRLSWKTIASENGSATYDDGIASFERVADGTRISIIGKQQFTLPLFWQVFDLNHIPALKSQLMTHAYQTFFDRTITNLEALVEGRDIRLGRPVDEPSPQPMELLGPLLQKVGELAMPLLQQLMRKREPAMPYGQRQTDEDGFVHVVPATADAAGDTGDRAMWLNEFDAFLRTLGDALKRDLACQSRVA